MGKKTNEIDLREKRFARLLADTVLRIADGNKRDAHRLIDAEIDAEAQGAISFTRYRSARSNVAKIKKTEAGKSVQKIKNQAPTFCR